MFFVENKWGEILKEEINKQYFIKLSSFLEEEYKNFNIYPPKSDIFNAFKLTSYSDVKAVILGQDPYHGEGQAHGLCFSVLSGTKKPPSLVNIYKELKSDLDIPVCKEGDLTKWAENGVLLMNTVLTVREGLPNSHKNMGWEKFTDNVIRLLNDREKPVVFILWGGNARAKKKIITNPNHLILESAHPSPLSAYNGFFDNKHFSKANEFLIKNEIEPIDWRLD